MLSFLCTWVVLSAIAAPIVGCVIAGRSVWSVFERAHHEDQGTNWRGLDAAE